MLGNLEIRDLPLAAFPQFFAGPFDSVAIFDESADGKLQWREFTQFYTHLQVWGLLYIVDLLLLEL